MVVITDEVPGRMVTFRRPPKQDPPFRRLRVEPITEKLAVPTGKALFQNENNTGRLMRTMMDGVVAGSVDQVVAMVNRARRRGTSYARIVKWFGPRAACPKHLHAIFDRVSLLASLEPLPG